MESRQSPKRSPRSPRKSLEEESFFDTLPDELLVGIFSYLDSKNKDVREVSKRFNKIFMDKRLLNERLYQNYGEFFDKLEKGEFTVEWIEKPSNMKDYSEVVKNIKVLDCSSSDYVGFYSLPPLPNVEKLNCSNNKLLRYLPSLPNIKILNCSNCRLESLSPLDRNGNQTSFLHLQSLVCRNNRLTSLPSLPNVTFLDCSNNQLTSLSPLNKKGDLNPLPNLEFLICVGNEIKYLPYLPKIKQVRMK